MISRRTFLQAAPVALVPLLPACSDDAASDAAVDTAVFRHGVASGDPLATAVVLWTRISAGSDAPASVDVDWSVATDPDFTTVVASGIVATTGDVDHTVKIDAGGLEPGTTYYYRFAALGESSPIGRTRTARVGSTERLRFALASCSNYPYGYFNAYAAIARRADLDAVIHLGDYIYEYREGDFGTGAPLGRQPDPATEALTAGRLPPAPRPLQERPRSAGGAPPAPLHRRVGRSRGRQRRLARRRREPPAG